MSWTVMETYFRHDRSPLFWLDHSNLFDKEYLKLGSITCKNIVRGQHLSPIKARLLWLVENVFSPIKMQQATSGTSAATYELMEPH